MFLIERIIEEFEQGTTPQAVALQALLPVGRMVADFDLSDQPMPYCIIIEHETTPEYTGFNGTVRVEKTPVEFITVAPSRETAHAIAEALDNLYQVTILNNVEDRVIDGIPIFDSRTPTRPHPNTDNWQSKIQFTYYTQKSF